MPVTLSPYASLRVNSAKGLAREAERSFAALRACPERSEGMTGLGLAGGEDLSRSFEPCLT
jgi:hypothetical protein